MKRRKQSKRRRTKRSSHKQTGKSVRKLDRKRQAKKPGWRRSKSGKKYYEARRNRSDKGRYL